MKTMQRSPLENGEKEERATAILPFSKTKEYYIPSLGVLSKKPFYDLGKRIFDILASSLALMVLCIPMLVIAVCIKCSSKGTVFYCQDRLGLNGKKFKIVKFRTMDMDAEINGAQWSSGEEDSRIFPFGYILRKWRADELPQFWCILKGDMSFVGPRPERECFYDEFETYIHGFKERLKVKPGLTGLAQVNGGYDLKPEEKIIYDVEYIKTRSMWLDIKLVFRTVKVVFRHEGAK